MAAAQAKLEQARFEQQKFEFENERRRNQLKDVDIGAIEEFVRRRGLSAQFMKLAEAREYRETLALREQEEKPPDEPPKFSAALFGTAGNPATV